MSKITLVSTHGTHDLLFDIEDESTVSAYGWFLIKQGNHLYPKARVRGTSKHVKLHRLLTNAQPGEVVDHINGNTLDNRRQNLRKCSIAENTKNQALHKDNKSGYKGVHWSTARKHWRVHIVVDRKQIYLGSYDSPQQASEAYDKAALQYFGEFARLNNI